VQEFKYAPKLTDNDSKVSCSLKSGESSDEFDLTVLTLESLSNNGKSASQFKYEVNDCRCRQSDNEKIQSDTASRKISSILGDLS